jgi:carbonic anhydrase/acetyltransferase-like protein (isoleucine patch superfamily)
VGEIPFLGRTLETFRSEELRAAKVDAERFTFADYAIATAPILESFARTAGNRRSKPACLALPSSSLSRALVPVSSVRRDGERLLYDVFLDAPKDTPLDALRGIAEPVLIESTGETPLVRELPRIGPLPHAIAWPGAGIVAAHVEHWVHVLWLEPLLVPALALRSGGRKKRWRRALAPSIIGEGADVHPSAYLEGAIIGDGAVVGARASIRHTYVGARSQLGDFTKLTHCVLGEDTHTLADGNFFWVVALGGGTLTSFLMKDTLLGKSVFLTSGVIFWNESLEGTIAVEREGRWIDTEKKCLGGCAGHGSVLGARTIVAPGRALPNRTTVVMRREEGVLRIDSAPPGTPMCWSDAAMVPVERIAPAGYVPDEIA